MNNTINKLTAVNAIEAVANYAECDPDDLQKENYDHYGLEVFSLGKQKFAVGTDAEADKAAKEYIKDTAWAFRSEFICSECDLPRELVEALEAMQSKRCEGANDAILALIDRSKGGLDSFVESAISADGRGHFLSPYDGNESEEGNFFVYRIN